MAGNLTWLGDSDPEAVSVTMFGHTFVKGHAVNVKDKALFERLSGNPMFSGDKDAETTPADEPTEDERKEKAEEGTAKAALKARLRELGISVQGNASEETLRAKLADATKAD